MSLGDQPELEARIAEYSGMSETKIRALMSGWKQHAPGWIAGDIVLQRRRDHALTNFAKNSPLLIGRATDFYTRPLRSESLVLFDFVWNQFRAKGSWPTTWATHQELGKQQVSIARKELNHAYLIENPSSSGQIYELQILGVLLTANGGQIQDLIEKYFTFLREHYPNASENAPIPSVEIQAALKLDDGDTKLLGCILDRLGLGSFSKLEDGTWSAYWSREIEDYAPEMEPNDFLKAFLDRRFGHINSNTPSISGLEPIVDPGLSFLQSQSPPFGPELEKADKLIVRALRTKIPTAADSYEQALRDLADVRRTSYRGPATDMREALRETLDYFAPDQAVIETIGYKQEADTNGPTMRQKIRYILNNRGQKKEHIASVENSTAAVDEIIGAFVRSVYTRSNISTHNSTNRQEVMRLRQYVRISLLEILEIHA